MLAKITYGWKILSELGITEGLDAERVRMIKTLNRVSFITALLVFPFTFPQINPTNDQFGWIEFVSSLGFLSVLVAHAVGYRNLGPVLIVLTANFKVFFSASTRGFEAGEQLFFIPLIVGIILMYDLRKDRIGQLLVLLSAGVWITLSATSYTLYAPEIPFPESVLREIFGLNLFISLLIIVSISFYYSRLAQVQQREIIQSKDQAEKASKAKSEFLSVISHELKTPLHGLLNYVEMLRDPSSSKTTKEDILEGLAESGNRLSLMVNNLLLVTEERSAPSALSHSVFEALSPLKEIGESMKESAAHSGLALMIREKEQQLFIETDLQKLDQILTNLVDNAIKFSESGTITLDYSIITTPENKRPVIRYSVEDQGIGISDEIKSHIFSPFFMHDSSVNRQTGGAGLGLAVSAGLAKQMGGIITVNSEEFAGSTFYVEIPVTIMEKGIPSMQSAHTKELTVLLVDDHPVNQKVASTMLKKLGYDYGIAANGEEAVSATESGKYHLIFMDIQMPVMDGIEATRQIRGKVEDHLQPVIIALTANTTENDKKACFEAGMNDFLAKPITKSAIGKAIDKWRNSIPDLD